MRHRHNVGLVLLVAALATPAHGQQIGVRPGGGAVALPPAVAAPPTAAAPNFSLPSAAPSLSAPPAAAAAPPAPLRGGVARTIDVGTKPPACRFADLLLGGCFVGESLAAGRDR